jgi:hypothetical protein
MVVVSKLDEVKLICNVFGCPTTDLSNVLLLNLIVFQIMEQWTTFPLDIE